MDARRALMLQVEWGADEALEASPMRRLREPSPPGSEPKLPAGNRPAQTPPARPPVAVAPRSALTAAPVGPFANLEVWRIALAAFDGAGLAATATHLVLPGGAELARPGGLLIVGEAPGEEEDRSGRAFFGREGQLLRKMLGSIGVDPESAVLAYLAPWRPPGGRSPSETEIAACLPFFRELARLVRPGLVLALGSVPAKALLGASARRGRWGEASLAEAGGVLPVLPTVNPAVLLKQPRQKAQAWADLRLLRRMMAEITVS